MTIAELLAANAASLKPANGDRAHTTYRGTRYVGTLENVRPHHADSFLATLRPDGYRDFTLTVGYDEPLSFDVAAGMWNAPADYD